MIITNKGDIPVEMAVWLLHDEYDYINEPNYISATSLMKPLRHILLPSRIPEEQRVIPDVEDFISRSMGNALHAGIEKAWKEGHKQALKLLGFPEEMTKRILINPTPEQVAETANPIVIYLEQRSFRQIDGYTVGGKFDMVAEGRVTDVKSTTAYTWLYGTRDDEYRLQGSIYRWLNPDKITEDFIRINFIFTDWQKRMAESNPAYPQRRVLHKDIQLLSLEETEAWIRDKIAQVERYKDTPEAELPECTDEELWLSDPEFKYYLDPAKASQPGSRSTKNFKAKDFPSAEAALAAAHALREQKGKGIVVTVPGEPKRCAYCQAFPICSQKDKYFNKEVSDD